MRIVLIGDFGGRDDEGMRRICRLIAETVAVEHEVLTISSKDFCLLKAYSRVRSFKPDWLHYLTGPTVVSLSVLEIHRRLLRPLPRTAATGLRPFLKPIVRRNLSLLRPDFYLAQARHWAEVFGRAGSRIMDFPNAVDCSKFRPVASGEERVSLRMELGIPGDLPIVLHVGHIRPSRNLECLLEVQCSGRYQVVIVGSESFSEKHGVREELEAAGCKMITSYLPDVERIYQAADVYVFTVKGLPKGVFPRSYNEIGVIDFPLSILEAMASGLRVVSTRHSALEHFIGEGSGIRYFDGSGEDCVRQIDAIRAEDSDPRGTAEKFALPVAWEALDHLYRSPVLQEVVR